MSEQAWIRFETQPLRDLGVYDVEVVEGDTVQSPPEVIRLHFTGTTADGWTMPDGSPYHNPFAKFLRYRRVGDLPD